MIRSNTVLILGAGASFDFGYPLGEDLKEKVIHVLSNSQFQSELEKGYGIRPAIKFLIKDFVEDLKKDRALTIDRYLSKSSKEYKWLGKVAIAKVIMDCEDDTKVFQSNNAWYKLLYSIIGGYPELDAFGANKLSVLTFNYDRSFEHFLFEQLRDDYGVQSQDKILSQLRNIPIIHLHGRVNLLPWEDSSKGFPYARKGYVPYITETAEKMILPDDENNAFNEAHLLIEKAESIYFLGFGYDQTNLKKLNIELISKCRRVFGTSHNLPVARQAAINGIFGREVINFYSTTVYDFFMKEFKPHEYLLN